MLSILVFLYLSTQTLAQDRTITGNITDYRGKPLAGVNVTVKDYPSMTTISGADGEFRIQVYDFTKALVFSFSGMKTKEVQLTELNRILVVMEYLAGKNPNPFGIFFYAQSYKSEIYNSSKYADSSWRFGSGSGFSATFEIEYSFTQKIIFSAGIGISSYKGKAWLDNFNNYGINAISRTDIDNETYYLYNQVNYLEEFTEVKALSLPIKIKYRFKPGKKWDFFIDGGLKLLQTTSASVKARGESTWQGYYPQYHIVLYDIPEYGFTTYSIDSNNDIPNYNKLMLSLIGNIGLSHSLGKKMNFDLGIFYERGISDLNYNEPVHQADFLNTVGILDKTSIRAIGIILGLRYLFIKTK